MAKKQPLEIGDIQFAGKGEASGYLKAMLNKYRPTDQVSAEDAAFLALALQRHPEATQKIGSGIRGFEVRSADFGTQCFWVLRTDGSEERFSYKSCV